MRKELLKNGKLSETTSQRLPFYSMACFSLGYTTAANFFFPWDNPFSVRTTQSVPFLNHLTPGALLELVGVQCSRKKMPIYYSTDYSFDTLKSDYLKKKPGCQNI